MGNWLTTPSIITRGQLLGWMVACVLGALLIGGGFGYYQGGLRGDARVADLQAQHSRAMLDVITQANARRDADLQRGEQLAGELAATQRDLADAHLQLSRRVSNVTTVYVPFPASAPVAIPRTVFTVGFVQLWDHANGVDLPATSAPACRLDGETGSGETVGEACLYDSGIGQAEILTNHIDNALRCRAIEATLDKYIQWHQETKQP